MTPRLLICILTCGLGLTIVGPAAAQPLGTFRWQLSPFCNVITVAVTQLGSQYRLEGSDDLCGAPTRAAVTGLVVPNPDGSLEFGLTLVTPAGPQHIDVTFSIASLGGPWRDNGGNSGTLIFNPSAVSGPPRPGGLGAVAINPVQVQARINGTCGSGLYVQGVNVDGSVACGAAGTGTVTSISAGPGLTGGGSSGAVSLAVLFGADGGAATAARSDHTHGFLTTNTSVGAQAASTASTTGGDNTAMGYQAMQNTAAGTGNTAVGAQALRANVGGTENTAVGMDALSQNVGGLYNTAVGAKALEANQTGYYNVGLGGAALPSNTSGSRNIAVGYAALHANTTGQGNVAVGMSALYLSSAEKNTAIGDGALANSETGDHNVAVGAQSMSSISASTNNTVVGARALRLMQTGSDNTAVGFEALSVANAGPNTAVGAMALHNIVGGGGNTAVGRGALFSAAGSNNIAIGQNAGSAVIGGNNNIFIGNSGVDGDDSTTRIGLVQTATFIAGVAGATIANSVPVLINANNGRLGTQVSSARFKERVAPIGAEAHLLQGLRPVSFVYKPEYDSGEREPQYGLIAEEVAETMPELVVRDAEGRPLTVRYHLLAPLLLAEVQRQERERAATKRAHETELAALRAEVAQLRAAIERR